MGFADVIFPKRCIGCGKSGKYVCEACNVGMWEEEQICPSCGRNSRYGTRHQVCKGVLDGAICLWSYEGITRKLIQRIKYGGYYDYLADLAFGNYHLADSSEFYFFNKFLESGPIVVPIPLHKNRLRKRGFNQAELIANRVAVQWKLNTGNLLVRIKDTKQQVGRYRNERLKAMEDAFEINEKRKTIDAKVLLVDDVWTTGATMNSAATVLKHGGAEKIWGFVLCR